MAATTMTLTGGIVTPEAVQLRFETAGIPSRALAKALDLLVSGAAVLFAFGVVAAVDASRGGNGLNEDAQIVVGLVATTLALFAYPAAAEARWGRTVGKAAVGLLVVTVEGGPLRGRHALIRAALQVVDLALVPVGVVAALTMLASPLDQRVGDRVAGTLVLRTRSGADEARALAFPPLPGYEGYVASLDVTGVAPEAYEVLRSFLSRVQQLEPGARFHLADTLARSLAGATGQDVPPGLHPELYCACIAAAYQQRHGGPRWW